MTLSDTTHLPILETDASMGVAPRAATSTSRSAVAATTTRAPSHSFRRLIEGVVALVFAVVALTMVTVSMNSQRTLNSQIAANGIRFPAAGSFGFSPSLYPTVQKYAGQLVNTGTKAEAYANGFIAPEISALTGGQTPAAVSQAAAANPQNAQLQAEAATVFQASTTKNLLLASWGLSRIANYTMLAGFAFGVGFILILALALFEMVRTRR